MENDKTNGKQNKWRTTKQMENDKTNGERQNKWQTTK